MTKHTRGTHFMNQVIPVAAGATSNYPTDSNYDLELVFEDGVIYQLPGGVLYYMDNEEAIKFSWAPPDDLQRRLLLGMPYKLEPLEEELITCRTIPVGYLSKNSDGDLIDTHGSDTNIEDNLATKISTSALSKAHPFVIAEFKNIVKRIKERKSNGVFSCRKDEAAAKKYQREIFSPKKLDFSEIRSLLSLKNRYSKEINHYLRGISFIKINGVLFSDSNPLIPTKDFPDLIRALKETYDIDVQTMFRNYKGESFQYLVCDEQSEQVLESLGALICKVNDPDRLRLQEKIFLAYDALNEIPGEIIFGHFADNAASMFIHREPTRNQSISEYFYGKNYEGTHPGLIIPHFRWSDYEEKMLENLNARINPGKPAHTSIACQIVRGSSTFYYVLDPRLTLEAIQQTFEETLASLMEKSTRYKKVTPFMQNTSAIPLPFHSEPTAFLKEQPTMKKPDQDEGPRSSLKKIA